MKKILVTGAAGFVGTILCEELLKRDYKVLALDNFYKANHDSLLHLVENDNFSFIHADINNPSYYKHLSNIDGIVHLAGIVGFPACKKSPFLSNLVNVNGTSELLEIRRIYFSSEIPFVFASTGSVYGKISETCTENTLPNPQSIYGVHKLRAEELVREEQNTISYRFATAFGVSSSYRVNLLVNDLVTQAVNNGVLSIFQADFRRTFIHVRDMARAFMFALENYHQMEYNVYNCGNQNLNWTKRQLAEYIKSKTGCEVFYADFRKDEDQRDYEVCYDRLTNEGFNTSISMEEGIDQLIKATPLLKVENYQ
jgi:nucleoside-diphosphate-sugar epimerase